ncbi:alpha/beta hydrolase [Variovorax sp. PAMC26660]|uniref:alpha/beta hydrolase n=1 Tax=Variovorax sp. PAMC26660 TaxID=2762322 RepID=UPI00164E6305|nr:alpha/beta hydrolase [Variovorax sp. PAMC26660]QNK67277.1 alpha/beta hydrolase [Variovorax sp. PAMC26660]
MTTNPPTTPAQPPLTAKMASVIERMARAGHPTLDQLTPDEAKASYEKGAGVLEVPKPELARIEDFSIAARDGFAIPARLYAPSLDVLPVLIYFHGGGFTVGNIRTHDTLCRVLSQKSGCAVVSVDYRLAPAHKFPTASNDAWDAFQFIAKEGASLGLDASRLAVGGDSAGGTLAAVCAILARDAGLPLALQMLIYPGTTAHQDTASHLRHANGPLLTKAMIDFFFAQYVRTPADRDDWRFAPLLADDVDGVAPAWIGLAECDAVEDEGIAYADKLRAAGVRVDLEIYRGVIHEFIKMGRAIPEALQAQNDAALALKEALNP